MKCVDDHNHCRETLAKEALLPTLCNDMGTSTDNEEDRRVTGGYQDQFDDWYKILTTPGLDANEIKAREDNSVSPFYYVLLDEDVEQELCITENGYMALVSEETQLGDRIAWLSGGSLPLVLRPLGIYYMVVEPCYVHGIMDGEAFPETESELELGWDMCRWPLANREPIWRLKFGGNVRRRWSFRSRFIGNQIDLEPSRC